MLLFTAVATEDDSSYDFNGIVNYAAVKIISRQPALITDAYDEPIPYRQIYNSLSYEYVSISKVIRGVPKGAIVNCRTVDSDKIERPLYGEDTPRSIQDVINSMQRLERLLAEPFETPFLQLQPEWRQLVNNLMFLLPYNLPIRFSHKRKQYCIYEYSDVKIIHCFTDKDEYILG